MSIDELKKKVESLKKREQNLLIREEAASALKSLYLALSTSTQEKISNNSVALLKEVAQGIEKELKKDNSTTLIEAIEKQTKDLKNDSTKAIAKELHNLAIGVQGLEKKTFFDQKAYDDLFAQTIEKITNVLIEIDQIPNDTIYARNDKGKIAKVTEKYNGYNLEHLWTYNRNGELIRVNTRRTNEK